jgi:ankyrin repeat protein
MGGGAGKASGPDPDMQGPQLTCLHAVKMGNAQLLEQLILAKIHPDVRERAEPKRTAMMVAAMLGHRDCVHSLMQVGCRVNAQDTNGYTPLLYAVDSRYPRVVELLVKPPADWARAKLHMHSNDGDWALTLAARRGDADATEHLVEAGAAMEMPQQCDFGDVALHVAIRYAALDVVDVLTRSKASMVYDGPYGGALHVCCAARAAPPEQVLGDPDDLPDSYLGILSGLIIRKADIDAKLGPLHETALHVAAKYGEKECAALLVQRRARLDLLDANGKKALQVADMAGFQAVGRFLAVDATLEQAKSKMEEKSEFMVSFEKDVAGRRQRGEQRGEKRGVGEADNSSTSPAALWAKKQKDAMDAITNAMDREDPAGFVKAVDKARLDTVKFWELMPSRQITAWERGTLHSCARANQPDAVRALLAAKVSPESKDLFGESPLHIAAETGFTEVAFWLLKEHADAGRQNKVGESPLTVALLKRHAQLVFLLRRALASPGGVTDNALLQAMNEPVVSEPVILS